MGAALSLALSAEALSTPAQHLENTTPPSSSNWCSVLFYIYLPFILFYFLNPKNKNKYHLLFSSLIIIIAKRIPNRLPREMATTHIPGSGYVNVAPVGTCCNRSCLDPFGGGGLASDFVSGILWSSRVACHFDFCPIQPCGSLDIVERLVTEHNALGLS